MGSISTVHELSNREKSRQGQARIRAWATGWATLPLCYAAHPHLLGNLTLGWSSTSRSLRPTRMILETIGLAFSSFRTCLPVSPDPPSSSTTLVISEAIPLDNCRSKTVRRTFRCKGEKISLDDWVPSKSFSPECLHSSLLTLWLTSKRREGVTWFSKTIFQLQVGSRLKELQNGRMSN